MALIPMPGMTRRQRPTPLDSTPKSDDEVLPVSGGEQRATTIRRPDLAKELKTKRFPNVRPRDAATLLVLDTSGGEAKLLMGQRHHGLKFMPGKFVFPGGRVEPQDYLASVGSRMPGPIRTKLLRHLSGAPHPQRAYAMVHAALRETQEETGIVIGNGARLGTSNASPDFEGFSLLARAITPPGRPRRFDTRFFVVSADRITERTAIVDGEFIAVEWFTLAEARQQDLPSITRMILDDLDARIGAGSVSAPEASVPFYFMRGACFHRRLL
jgi:8-oxo-dGTP pyrophosphatase MutT (NUDIX family)